MVLHRTISSNRTICMLAWFSAWWNGSSDWWRMCVFFLLIQAWHCNNSRTLFGAKQNHIQHVLHQPEKQFRHAKNQLSTQMVLWEFTVLYRTTETFFFWKCTKWSAWWFVDLATKRVLLLFWCQACSNRRTHFGATKNHFQKVSIWNCMQHILHQSEELFCHAKSRLSMQMVLCRTKQNRCHIKSV